MRRSFNRAMMTINAILAQTGGIDPETGEKRKLIKQRFVAGDHFYQGLPFKRVKGKWCVKS